MKLSKAAEQYVAWKQARGGFTPDSADKAAGCLHRVIEACGDVHLRRVNKEYAEAVMRWLRAGRALSTQNWYWSIFNVFMEWCVDEELAVRNPFRKVKPSTPPRRLPRPLTVEQVAAVLAHAERVDGPRGRLMVVLMVQQGLRCKGVAGLQVRDVDLGRGWMRLREKGGHERELSITDECREAIEAYLARYPEVTDGPLVRAYRHPGFPTAWWNLRVADGGLKAASVSKIVTEWMYEAGVKRQAHDEVTPHALRHTCATDMLEAGADIMEVAAALGHASVATTMVYTKVRSAALARAMSGRRYGRPTSVPDEEAS